MMPRPIVYKHARPAYLDVQAFADHFAISKMSAYRLLHTGVVKWVRVGRSMRIPVGELARYTKEAEHASSIEVWGDE